MTNKLKFKLYVHTKNPEFNLEFRTYSQRGLIHRIDKCFGGQDRKNMLFNKYSTHLKA